jgi:hypothetical protein
LLHHFGRVLGNSRVNGCPGPTGQRLWDSFHSNGVGDSYPHATQRLVWARRTWRRVV